MATEAGTWERLQTLFHGALERSGDERAAWLAEQCGSDAQLLADVLAMLEADARGGSLLSRSIGQVASDVLDPAVPAITRIGPYRVLSVLGQGGMGVVYLARREDLGSTAAIKMMRDASLSPMRRERFASEQRTLAQLNHPSIARLYDADTLPDGTPYFVMEYVPGLPLMTWCTAQRATLQQRLHSFRAVCDAVQYAHRHAVIHRDLKPSNILVTADGGIKLLDFGIAKQLESLDTPADQTQTVLRMMTPAYAAPEQVRGDPVGIYTDVYALGVILYELLTGRLPFDVSQRTPGRMEAAILEQEPERPSLAVRHGGMAEGLAQPIGRTAWADLDVLCLTAMHKDAQRRYRTVEALLRDVDHFLQREPLEARPDTLGYRAGKFLRRNWQAVTAASIVSAIILGLVVFYTIRLTNARDAALAEAARAQRIQSFMLNLFEGGDAAAGPADTLRVLTLVDRGVREARALDVEPATQAELFETLGTIYQKLGNLERADSLLQNALRQRRSIFGPIHPDVAASMISLGLLRADQAQLEESEQLIRDGVAVVDQLLPPEHPAALKASTALGHVLQARGQYDQSVKVLEDAVRRESLRAAMSPELSETITELASTHFYAGNLATADSLFHVALRMDRELYGERHPNTGEDLVNLGAVQQELGNYSAAERFFRDALAITEAHFGPDHHRTAANLTQVARALLFLDKYEESATLLRRALAVRERVYGPVHPSVASTLNELGSVAFQQGDLAVAEKYYSRNVDIYRAVYGETHYLLGIAQSNLASVYMNGGQLQRSEQLFRQVVDLYERVLAPENANTAIARIKLGRALTRQQRYTEAEPYILAGYNVMVKQSNPGISFLRAARQDLVTVYENTNRQELAARFRAELEAAAQPAK
jgi:serine/threonine-protein kinase